MTLTLTDYVHIVQTGQSLAGGGPIGGSGTNLTTVDPYPGTLLAPTSSDSFIDAVEPLPDSYRESGCVAMLKTLYEYVGSKKFSIRTDWKGGTAYTGLKKGTAYYNSALAYVTHGKTAAGASSFSVMAVVVVHGEKDTDIATPISTYAADLVAWQNDYETDIKAITGQSGTIPMILTQVTSWPAYTTNPTIGLAQLQATRENPTKILLAGPKYHLPYISDGIHLTSESYYDQGEYHAKVAKAIYAQTTWVPLKPTSITSVANVITATFDVPVPPLVLDTTTIPAQTNKGFTFTDDTGATISSVALQSTNQVLITLSGTPTNGYLRYGYATGAYGNVSGGGGNLRDSDTATSARASRHLYNWCCHFNDAVGLGSSPPPTFPTLYGRLT